MVRVLVSGANGFIGAHVVAGALARGWEVTGTVRDPADSARTGFLRNLPGAGRLNLVAADLTAPDPFGAHADVDGILHVASPYVISVRDPARDLVAPAVEGTLSMLRAARANPGVKRVVVTSSFAAVTDAPPPRRLSEADWNGQSSLRRNPYYYSKTQAERAAWDYMETEKPGFSLVVLNPGLVIGPALGPGRNTSTSIFSDLHKGVYPVIMAIGWAAVDVRDVAEAHLRALERPGASGRNLLAAGPLTCRQAVDLMRAEGLTGRLPRLDLTGPVGTALLRLGALTQKPGVRDYLRTNLGRMPDADNGKSVRELGMDYRPVAESLRDTLRDLIARGEIKPD
jgi:dihydroflavonol-4-reductase